MAKNDMNNKKLNLLELEKHKQEIKNSIKKLKIDIYGITYTPDDYTNLEGLGNFIRDARQAQKWSTAKLAELSGISSGLINRIENNKCDSSPKLSTLLHLANALNITLDKLFSLVGSPADPEPRETYQEIMRKNWKSMFTSQLHELGLKPKYIEEIINYIETVKVKQDIEENNL